jgi:hypothetical protein
VFLNVLFEFLVSPLQAKDFFSEVGGVQKCINKLSDLLDRELSGGEKIRTKWYIIETERAQGQKLWCLVLYLGDISLIFEDHVSKRGVSSILLMFLIMSELNIKVVDDVFHLVKFREHVGYLSSQMGLMMVLLFKSVL